MLGDTGGVSTPGDSTTAGVLSNDAWGVFGGRMGDVVRELGDV